MPGTRSSGMHIRVNPEIKAKAEPILAAIGLSFSDVFNLTLNQICLKRRIPFELSSIELTENEYTPSFEAEILAEAQQSYAAISDGTAEIFDSVDDMVSQWDKEDAEEDD
jgi:addiction module RelB/DinJ family antitoxin